MSLWLCNLHGAHGYPPYCPICGQQSTFYSQPMTITDRTGPITDAELAALKATVIHPPEIVKLIREVEELRAALADADTAIACLEFGEVQPAKGFCNRVCDEALARYKARTALGEEK